MPIRTVKHHSDRGSLKNIVKDQEGNDIKPLPSELRLKKLFEYSKLHKNEKLLSALGFITTDYIEDKNAIPLSVYRLRKIVDDISSRPDSKISEIKNQLEQCFGAVLSKAANDYLNQRKVIRKIASICRPSFWRAE